MTKEEDRPVAYVRHTMDGRWAAYDHDWKLIVADIHRDVVIRVCEERGYKVIEA